MSSAIVRKSLELFKEDITGNDEAQQKKQKKGSKVKETVSAKRKRVRKEMTMLKQRQARGEGTQRKKTLVDDSAKFLPQDNTLENVGQLTRLSQLRATHTTTVSKIMRHNKGRLAKNQMKKEDKSKQGSVFTDKDFAVFEKEYVT